MSYIISGLNIKNISEYDSSISYSKYDIIDFQFTTGVSVYPSYTGNGQTGLTTWFNNDLLENFLIDTKFEVTGWKNLVVGSGDLKQTGNFAESNPYVDFNSKYINFENGQLLSGTGFASPSRTIILLVDVGDIKYLTQTQNILKFGDHETSGVFQLSGTNSLNNAKVIVDSQQYSAVSPIYDTKNIFSLVQNSVSNSIKVRQNGNLIGTYSSFDSNWKSGSLVIGNNSDNYSTKYYEIIHFSGVLSDTEINYYEKYLYEKYFDNTRLFFAKENVPVGIQYNPLTFTGQNYWTQDIDDLFKLSYGSSVNFSANLSPLLMGDGYKTNIAQTVNTLNSKFSFNYEGLTDKEAKCLIAYYENTPETSKKSLYEGFKGVNMNLFSPYKNNAELYFKSISHNSPYNNINTVKIEAESLYDSSLDYKGMLIELDEDAIKTYPTNNQFQNISYNDIFYYDSDSINLKGYYFYTGVNYIQTSSGPTGPLIINPQNSPTGTDSYFTNQFYFKGDIDYNIDSTLRLLDNELKNSTMEYDKDGLNYNILEFTVSFTNRSNVEARAILKFLDSKIGFKRFDYTLPQPYNKTINVYCPEWSHTYKFYDNNDISIKLIEFKNPFVAETNFNTSLIFTA